MLDNNVIQPRHNQPLIGILTEDKTGEFVKYFTDEKMARKAIAQDGMEKAIALAGAWSSLDWKETKTALENIRKNEPTPPIDRL